MRLYHLNPHAALLTTAALLLMTGGLAALASEVDARILATARLNPALRPRFKGIKVHCVHGRARLTGTVAEALHRTLAEQAVAGLPGVRSVDNRIIVAGSWPVFPHDLWASCKDMAAQAFRTLFLP